MNRPPAFLFYPRDFLVDAHVDRMTLEQIGAYVRLLCFAWLEGGLDANLDGLAGLCHISRAEFETRIWPALRPCFRIEGGRIVQKRLERSRAQSAKASAHGRAAAIARWSRS